MRIEHSIDIAASVRRVWELTADIESWPEFTTTITTIERLDTAPLQVGSAARVKQPGQRARVWTITAIDPEQRFVWSTGLLGTTVTAAHILRESEAGTANTLSVDIEGKLSRLIGTLVRRPIASALETENDGFKAAAEGAAYDEPAGATPVRRPPHSKASAMSWKPFSDERIRQMYASGRGDATARRMARFWAGVHSLGLLPKRWVTLEVPGHRSGELRRFPLGLADVDGRWYLVSMLGECAWVRNVRAADGRVVLRRRRGRECILREVPAEDRGPILRRYVDKVPGGRPHIPVERGASVEEFQAVAADYPVFIVVDDADETPG